MVKVIIIEDDPMVLELNKRYVETIDGFKVVASTTTAVGAVDLIKQKNADLLILDVYLPKISGIELLSKIRNEKVSIDVILITASKESQTIDRALRLGAVDYLIKPFEYERFKKALIRYSKQRDILDKAPMVKQDEIDRLLGTGQRKVDSVLKKGLHEKTLEMVRKLVAESETDKIIVEDISSKLGVSKVTARRYLEYLISVGDLTLEIEYGKVGRPTHYYKRIDK